MTKTRKRITPKLQVKKRLVLDEDFIQKFCKYLKEGMPIDAICDYMGIDGTTFFKWVRNGESYIDGGYTPSELEIFGIFVQQMREQAAAYRFTVIRRLSRPSNRNWQRDMAILERRDRRNFGKVEQPGGTIEEFNPDEKFL